MEVLHCEAGLWLQVLHCDDLVLWLPFVGHGACLAPVGWILGKSPQRTRFVMPPLKQPPLVCQCSGQIAALAGGHTEFQSGSRCTSGRMQQATPGKDNIQGWANSGCLHPFCKCTNVCPTNLARRRKECYSPPLYVWSLKCATTTCVRDKTCTGNGGANILCTLPR